MTVEYRGTAFAGWARQRGQRTVQAELERALTTILRREWVTLTVAGRTDAGVHACRQVASYEGDPVAPGALNAVLPDDVAVIACDAAPAGFSARHDATSRAYRYRLLTRAARSAHDPGGALHWPYPLDRAALDACAALLPGRHDFTAFTPTETSHVRFTRDVIAARWTTPDADHLEFWIEADTFMRHMNRVLVGTMLEVGSGRRSLAAFAALLAGAPRAQAGPTAPAHGLYLAAVGYEGERILDPVP
ncbi:MAG TPA: tRNA pseudouridine synthase A [Solirubrobacteraceae bacterium]|nr:tRNA pseudouridine synthase A [Solirubrobacteraceae bacterium]